MVDPKRHINILTPKEQSFLEECENEFANRFTDLDEEFMAHCQRPSKPPPIVHPWNVRRGGGGGGPWRGHGGDRRFGDRGGREGHGARYRAYSNNRGYRRNNYREEEHHRSGRDQNSSDSRSHYRSDDRRYDRETNR